MTTQPAWRSARPRSAKVLTRGRMASIGLAAGSLAIGYGLGGLWVGMALVLALGALWLVSLERPWSWTASLGLVGLVGAAAAGLGLHLEIACLVLATVAALCAWDLDHWTRRLADAGRVEGQASLEERHLRRLLAVAGLSLLLAAASLQVEIRLPFFLALLLGLLAVLGLGRAIAYLRHEGD